VAECEDADAKGDLRYEEGCSQESLILVRSTEHLIGGVERKEEDGDSDLSDGVDENIYTEDCEKDRCEIARCHQLSRAAQRNGRSAAANSASEAAQAPTLDARRLPNHNWNALLAVSCSALLDRAPRRLWEAMGWTGKIGSQWTPR
jgi:hypothetical protein